jgi:hypothetical protein
MPGSAGADLSALRLARRIARELMAEGAGAVVLLGSHATGTHHAQSDLDIYAIGRGRQYALSRRGAYLVSTGWATVAAVRRSFRDPGAVCGAIPGWREAIILADPEGIAAHFRRRAERWTWKAIDTDCDRWVAEQLTGWSEEVHKLVAMLERGEQLSAAAQRSVLAVRLAPILAVHRRILYGSENRLWDFVAEAMGEPWASTQRAAFALDGESPDNSARAALRLFTIAADDVGELLSKRQRGVVEHARSLAMRVLAAT